jgi:hypothetical protein
MTSIGVEFEVCFQPTGVIYGVKSCDWFRPTVAKSHRTPIAYR